MHAGRQARRVHATSHPPWNALARARQQRRQCLTHLQLAAAALQRSKQARQRLVGQRRRGATLALLLELPGQRMQHRQRMTRLQLVTPAGQFHQLLKPEAAQVQPACGLCRSRRR